INKKYISLVFSYCLVFVFLVALVTPVVVGAQSGTIPGDSGIQNPLGEDGPTTLMSFIEIIITNIVLPIASVVVVLAIIYSGFLFVAARGNPTKLEHARTAFTWTVVGTAVLLGSWVIAAAIEGTLCEITDGNIPGLCN
ncbi:MAG: hypothetical protein WEC58_02385, partial [Candidatus Paceibacterota bacterium]